MNGTNETNRTTNGTANATNGIINGTANGTNGTAQGRTESERAVEQAARLDNLQVTDDSFNLDNKETIPDTDRPRLVRTMIRDEHDQVVGESLVTQHPGQTHVIHVTAPNGTTIATPATRQAVEDQKELEDMGYPNSNTVTTRDIDGNIINEYENPTPLDQFNIKNILGLDLMDNASFSLTNMGLFTTLSLLLIIYGYIINNNFNKIVPNNTSASSESIYHTIHGIVISQIDDKKGQQFFPLIFVLFIFILVNNLIGMVPYTFASTSHFILTFSLSFTIVLGATYLGLYLHKLEFFSLFVPTGCPLPLLYLLVLIEFISYLSRPVSLGLRLAANVLSGHMLLNILSGFTYNIMNSGKIQFFLALLPLAFVIAFSGLEVGVAFIQAQVFAVLSCSYIRDGSNLH